MLSELYIADCNDQGLGSELSEIAKVHSVEHIDKNKYYYPTGADHPGLWLVLTFVGSSVAGGFIHDGFKAILNRFKEYCSELYYKSFKDIDDLPSYGCLVIKYDDIELEMVIDNNELEDSFIPTIIAKVRAIKTLLDKSELHCKVTLPIEHGYNLWNYQRSMPASGYRFWLVTFDEQSLVFDSVNHEFIFKPEL